MDLSSLKLLNELSESDALEQFQRCCGAANWCRAMIRRRPYDDLDSLHTTADLVMDGLAEDDWREAFACHPPIGDLNSLRMKYSGNREWSAGEQAGMNTADESTLEELARGNADYKEKFGFIFIVCATGKSAAEMLAILKSRFQLGPAEELANAAREQRKITHLRIDKMEIQ